MHKTPFFIFYFFSLRTLKRRFVFLGVWLWSMFFMFEKYPKKKDGWNFMVKSVTVVTEKKIMQWLPSQFYIKVVHTSLLFGYIKCGNVKDITPWWQNEDEKLKSINKKMECMLGRHPRCKGLSSLFLSCYLLNINRICTQCAFVSNHSKPLGVVSGMISKF